MNFLLLFLNQMRVFYGQGAKKKALVPCKPRDKDLVKQALCGTTLVDAGSNRALSRASNKALHGNGCFRRCLPGVHTLRQAAPGGLHTQLVCCLPAPGSSLQNGGCALLFPICAFVKLKYTANRIFCQPILFPKKSGGKMKNICHDLQEKGGTGILVAHI